MGVRQLARRRLKLPIPLAGAFVFGCGGRGGFGGAAQGAIVAPGRYQAVLARLDGDKVTPIGPSQSFFVVQIPQ